MSQNAINLLGFRARDRITGFSGVISTVGFDLYGCLQALITPPVDDKGDVLDSRWFDTNRIEITGERVMPVPTFAGAEIPTSYDKGPAEKSAPNRV